MEKQKPVQSYRELIAWQKAFHLALEVYRVSSDFPEGERYGLTAQLRRAAISIPSNLAEGYGRNRRGEYVQFVGIAKGSLCELETQLLLAKELGFSSEIEPLLMLTDELGRILRALKFSLESSMVKEETAAYGASVLPMVTADEMLTT